MYILLPTSGPVEDHPRNFRKVCNTKKEPSSIRTRCSIFRVHPLIRAEAVNFFLRINGFHLANALETYIFLTRIGVSNRKAIGASYYVDCTTVHVLPAGGPTCFSS